MLPGVEVARKRRIHHHYDHSTQWLIQGQKTTTADASSDVVLLARQRLEKKLRGSFFHRHTPVSSTSPRWMQLSDDINGKKENHGRFNNGMIIISNCSNNSSSIGRGGRRRTEENEDQSNGRTRVKFINGRIPTPSHWPTCRKSIGYFWKSFSKLMQRKKFYSMK